MQGSELALFFFARYACQGKTYGIKLLGTARELAGKDPRVVQVDQMFILPSAGPINMESGRRLSQGRLGKPMQPVIPSLLQLTSLLLYACSP